MSSESESHWSLQFSISKLTWQLNFPPNLPISLLHEKKSHWLPAFFCFSVIYKKYLSAWHLTE